MLRVLVEIVVLANAAAVFVGFVLRRLVRRRRLEQRRRIDELEQQNIELDAAIDRFTHRRL